MIKYSTTGSMISAGVDETLELVDVFHYDLIVEYFDPALGDEVV